MQWTKEEQNEKCILSSSSELFLTGEDCERTIPSHGEATGSMRGSEKITAGLGMGTKHGEKVKNKLHLAVNGNNSPEKRKFCYTLIVALTNITLHPSHKFQGLIRMYVLII